VAVLVLVPVLHTNRVLLLNRAEAVEDQIKLCIEQKMYFHCDPTAHGSIDNGDIRVVKLARWCTKWGRLTSFGSRDTIKK
jgi:hypothetical protein